MSQYKVFVKDCLDLTGLPIANTTCLSFSISKDLLTSATSNFVILEELTDIKVGDILGLYDPYGTILYEGVIESFTDTEISCKEILSIFNDNWLWWDDTDESTIEGKLESIINTDFVNSSDSLIARKFPFTVSSLSSTTGTFKAEDTNYVTNFETFLNEIYDQYGIIVEVNIPFEATTPTITIKKATNPSIKIGNNAWVVRNLTPLTEVVQTNKLIIYDTTGTLRATYYCTTNGIVTNDADPLRLPVVKTDYVFDDDTAVGLLVGQHLQSEIYNHRITFDLLLNSNLYDFYEWELGQELDIWYNSSYYSTIFTGYSMNMEQGMEVFSVSIVCGKVRNKLTEVLNGLK